MADTTTMECKKCEVDGDCIQGICSACAAGDYFCKCGAEVTEHQLDNIGCCEICM